MLITVAQITIKEADSKHAQIVLSNCDLAYRNPAAPRYPVLQPANIPLQFRELAPKDHVG